ncbi:hypothetical protein FOXYSP1_17901 [Fusarium oxysporum f. sp. phaseoli]
MVEKDRKVGASRIENNPPSIADLGKVFDEIAEERLGRRDPTSRRWQRKTWAPPIWTRKSEHFAILSQFLPRNSWCIPFLTLPKQMLPHSTFEPTPTSKARQRGPFDTCIYANDLP